MNNHPKSSTDELGIEAEVMDAIVEVGLHTFSLKEPAFRESGIRPNHHIPGRNYTFIGGLNFIDQESLRPGESCLAHGRFIIATQDHELFQPGFAWHIGEAYKIVGYCKLVEVNSFSKLS